jgi:D-alanine-D-alanine ligase
MDGRFSNVAQRIALLAGGESTEREVSFASGQQVALALALAGYEPVLIDPAETNLRDVDWPSFDCCFVALHGGAGEDGRVQAELEKIGIPYTGSGPNACLLAMSKSDAKRQFDACAVPTPWHVAFNHCNFVTAAARAKLVSRLAPLQYPLVIKPNGHGSSLGVQVARELNDVPRCIAAASEFDSELIAETWIDGREFTIGLLGRDVLPMIEIVAPQRVFSYEAKYASAKTQYRFDSELSPGVARKMYETAIAAAEALGTAGLVRVDFMLDRQDNPWVLELNTIPGMTARSLAPRAAAASGFDMPTLVDWMVRDALRRHAHATSPAHAVEFSDPFMPIRERAVS